MSSNWAWDPKKDEGNELYKDKLYEKAAAKYTECIFESVRHRPNKCARHEIISLDDASTAPDCADCEKILGYEDAVSKLYNNRAISYSSSKSYVRALHDLNMVIQFTMYPGGLPPWCDRPVYHVHPTTHSKAQTRRCKVLSELGNYHSALMDYGMTMKERNNTSNNNDIQKPAAGWRVPEWAVNRSIFVNGATWVQRGAKGIKVNGRDHQVCFYRQDSIVVVRICSKKAEPLEILNFELNTNTWSKTVFAKRSSKPSFPSGFTGAYIAELDVFYVFNYGMIWELTFSNDQAVWEKLRDQCPDVKGPSLCVVKIKGGYHIFLYGGLTRENEISNELYDFDVATKRLLLLFTEPSNHQHPNDIRLDGEVRPEGRHEAALWYDPNRKLLCLFGGECYSDNNDERKHAVDMWLFSLESNRWFIEPMRGNFACTRASMAMTTYNSKAFIHGGIIIQQPIYNSDVLEERSSKHLGHDSYIFEDGVWRLIISETAIVPQARHHHSAIVDKDGRFFIFGGINLKDEYLTDVWELRTPDFKEHYLVQEADEFKAKGNEYFEKNMFSEAITQYTKAIYKYPYNEAYYGNRAVIYMKLEMYDRVIENCLDALSLNAGHLKSLNRLALAYRSQQQHDIALYFASKYLELDRNNEQMKQTFEEIKKAKTNGTMITVPPERTIPKIADVVALERKVRVCLHCGKIDSTMQKCNGTCSGTARYCGRECQVAHWPKHKLVCRRRSNISSSSTQKKQKKN